MQYDIIQLYTNMGHPKLNDSEMLKDDFYVLVTKNHKLGLRKKLNKNECIIFEVISKYIQVANICGNKEDYQPVMHKNDFYTICMKDSKNNIGLRAKDMIVFNDESSLLGYLCSDFARFCLALFKNNQHNDGGNMAMIPKHPIPISDELREYIESFLPDYYDIRTNRKEI